MYETKRRNHHIHYLCTYVNGAVVCVSNRNAHVQLSDVVIPIYAHMRAQ